jgi:spoIIIJ-associated protein
MTSDVTRPIVQFLERFIAALGISATVNVEETDDGPRLNLTGEEAELLVRHRGEPLKALQHVIDTPTAARCPNGARVRRRSRNIRKGKDIELRNMAKFLAEKAKQTGVDQRNRSAESTTTKRGSCISVAEVPGVTTESVGDAFSDRPDLVKKVGAEAPAVCSQPPTRSSRSRRRRAAAASVSCVSADLMPKRSRDG